MSGRIYTVSFDATASPATASYDILTIQPADDKPCEVLGLFLGQSTELGDATSELIRYKVIRGHATVTGGTSVTPRPLNRSDAAAAFTATQNNTTIASTGTPVDLHADTFHVATGEKLWLPEGCEWQVAQGDTSLVIRSMGQADAITFTGTLYVRELG